MSNATTSNYRFQELPLNQIEFFKKNPRRTRNPQYERLRDSIEMDGVKFPLIVAKKPDTDKYVLQAGGNTRLEIFRSLHEQDEERFGVLPCVVTDWESDFAILLTHLKENDLRGDLTFFERATGVMDLWLLLKQETKAKRLSQRGLAKQLSQRGFAISQTLISYMDYAVKRLYPLIPIALEHGLSRKQVVRIRSLETAAERMWHERMPKEKNLFNELFSGLCKRLDGEDFDCDDLRDGVEYEIAQSSDLDLHAVKLLLGAEERGESFDVPDETQLEPIAPIADAKTNGHPEPHDPSNEKANLQPSERRELTWLRKSAFKSASKLAEQVGIEECLYQLPKNWFGYCMIEFPAADCSESGIAVWKLLATCSEQPRLTKKLLLPLLNTSSKLYTALKGSRVADVYDQLQVVDAMNLGNRLFRKLDDDGWKSFMSLLASYRRITVFAEQHDLNLWSE